MKLLSLACLPLCCALLGCAPPPELTTAPLDEVLEAYRLKNERLQRAAEVRGVELLKVDTTGAVRGVSVHARNAPLQDVVQRLLEASGQAYVYDGVGPAGMVTARFTARPLLEALNLLLTGHGYEAVQQRGVLVIRDRIAPPDAASADTTATGEEAAPAHAEVLLTHLSAEEADTMLLRLYPPPPEQPPLLRHTAHPANNSVLLAGPPALVGQATTLLRRADQAPAHVLLEALVVQFNQNALLELGADVSGGSLGRFRNLLLQFGAGSVEGIGFSWVDSTALPGALSVLVQALAATDAAQVIARPYVSTRSGDAALVSITRDRYVVFPVSDVGPLFTETAPITAGVLLEILPTVMPGEGVRVEMNVEESQFLPQLTPTSVDVNRNAATTTMQVASGQTIVIGGLALDRQVVSNRGIPLLRRIPVLNLLFAQQQESGSDQEVVIFITPYVWEPGMETPLRVPGAFREGESFISPPPEGD